MREDIRGAADQMWSTTLTLNAFEGIMVVLLFGLGVAGAIVMLMGRGDNKGRRLREVEGGRMTLDEDDVEEEDSGKEALPKYASMVDEKFEVRVGF